MKSKPYNDIENTLIDKINKGDTNAFRQLVDTYKDESLSLAFSIIKDKEVAEDVLQQVFIKVYEKIHTFNHQSRFSTWLYRIVINMSYNELKKIRRTITIDNITLQNEELIKREHPLQEEDQKKFINAALSAMKSDEALILRLFYLLEMSIKEIEKVTGFSTSKVKVNLHRGRSNLEFQLRKLLGDELKDLL